MRPPTRTPAAAAVDRIFRAFSDRTRLRILNLLRHQHEVCVCDVIRILGAPQAKVSRHLAYLRRAGLVVGRKDGLWVHYRLVPARGAFHAKLLECLSCCFNDVPELRRDLNALQRLRPGTAANDRAIRGTSGDPSLRQPPIPGGAPRAGHCENRC